MTHPEQSTLPISETFVSIQGEGRWTGTPMFFIRLAGCSVGRGKFPYTCHAWDNKEFGCDTDYRRKVRMSIDELARRAYGAGLHHVSVTGGEPLMHSDSLYLLLEVLTREGMRPHVETSGTILILYDARWKGTWWTVSPKQGYLKENLDHASEIKVLIDEKTDPKILEQKFGEYAYKLFLQPINAFNTIDAINANAAITLLTHKTTLGKHGASLSLQMHKVLGVR